MVAGKSGTQNHTSFCAKTISVRFKLPTSKKISNKMNPIPISYEIICAADRRAPINEYLVLLDHPEQMTP
jgi:hypothetical protein